MDLRELAWAAGLFEGEGCISVSYRRGVRMRYPQVTLAMNDEDVVRRFHAAVGVGSVTHGRLWTWNANSWVNCQAVVALLWFGLGARRRNRAAEVFAEVKASQVYRKRGYRWGGRICDAEDCETKAWARGMCGKHYQRWYIKHRRAA